ncbi:hypothetical protein HAZT_HAZT002950 [Hyalella azteca]|uniref:Transporter n=1 Tax=Hyalella azteca TaxID=294128 RepID=A0A6A0H574_HYAAZ|nr:hypothetical protein HAZT_HAZT002950 [Hyalella azteca]
MKGAFLIPYVVCALVGGVPMFFLEVGIGQFMSEGGISVWKMCPLFRGIGYAAISVCNLLNMYYIVIIAWALYYFVLSFQSTLPWATCGNWWNTAACVSDATNHSTLAELRSMNITPRDSVVEFWEHSKKKIRRATFPYVMLTALLIRGVTLPGAAEGIRYYLEPKWEKIFDHQVWNDAGTQIFYSYAVGLGGMVALGSYNKFNNNFAKQCAILCACNSLTSLFAGFGIFSVLGYMSLQLELPMDKVAEAGPGLVFIAYPKAMAQMPFAPLWSAMFFCMILMVGLDSQFVQVESVVTAIVDLYPNLLRTRRGREIVVAAVCLLDFAVGCSMVMQGGMYVFQLFDYFAASGIILLTVCGLEATVLSWVYGADRLMDNMDMMLGFRLWRYFKLAWKYITPLQTCVSVCNNISVRIKRIKFKRYGNRRKCKTCLAILVLEFKPGKLVQTQQT